MKTLFTRCFNGHVFDALTTYVRADGRRECRTCRDLATARSRAKSKASAAFDASAAAPDMAAATGSTASVRRAAGASHSAPGPGKGSGIAPHGKGSGADLSLDYDRPPGFPHDGDFDLPERLTPAAPCLDCGHGVGHYAQCAAAGLS